MDAPEPNAQRPSSGFFSLPSSIPGKWSVWLLAASLLLILLNNLVVMPWMEQVEGFVLAQSIINLTIFLCVVANGLVGLLAVISKHERSVVVFLSILLMMFALSMNMASLVG